MLQVVDIACGSLHSACITEDGALYTWGKGKYGRLGHGNNDDKMVPTKVTKVSEILGSCCWDIKFGTLRKVAVVTFFIQYLVQCLLLLFIFHDLRKFYFS